MNKFIANDCNRSSESFITACRERKIVDIYKPPKKSRHDKISIVLDHECVMLTPHQALRFAQWLKDQAMEIIQHGKDSK